jgi:N-methylhydantoinase B/oxoprolinase/acetone carboxylase alpha subunit
VKAHITRQQELQSPVERQAQENQLMTEQRIMRLEAKLAALTDTVSQLKETVLSLLDLVIEQKKGLE